MPRNASGDTLDAASPVSAREALPRTRPFDVKTAIGRLMASQGGLLLALDLLLFGLLSLTIDRFFTAGNLRVGAASMSVLGMLAIAQALVVISGAVDLSVVMSAVVATTACLEFLGNHPTDPFVYGLALGLGIAVLIGLVNTLLTSFFRIPPLIATLAVSLAGLALANLVFIKFQSIPVPQSANFIVRFTAHSTLGVPDPVLLLVLVALGAGAVTRFTTWGRYIFAVGGNFDGARITGIPHVWVRLSVYLASGVMAFVAGLVLAGTVDNFNVSLSRTSLLYDILTVVVIGGVSLGGGRGTILGVIAGTILIWIIQNGMSLLDWSTNSQAVVKGLIFIVALGMDRHLRSGPRRPEFTEL